MEQNCTTMQAAYKEHNDNYAVDYAVHMLQHHDKAKTLFESIENQGHTQDFSNLVSSRLWIY